MLGLLSRVFHRVKAICKSESILLNETGACLDYRAGLGVKDYAIHVKHMIYRQSNPHGKEYEQLKEAHSVDTVIKMTSVLKDSQRKQPWWFNCGITGELLDRNSNIITETTALSYLMC